jgi:hypothetical protein
MIEKSPQSQARRSQITCSCRRSVDDRRYALHLKVSVSDVCNEMNNFFRRSSKTKEAFSRLSECLAPYGTSLAKQTILAVWTTTRTTTSTTTRQKQGKTYSKVLVPNWNQDLCVVYCSNSSSSSSSSSIGKAKELCKECKGAALQLIHIHSSSSSTTEQNIASSAVSILWPKCLEGLSSTRLLLSLRFGWKFWSLLVVIWLSQCPTGRPWRN